LNVPIHKGIFPYIRPLPPTPNFPFMIYRDEAYLLLCIVHLLVYNIHLKKKRLFLKGQYQRGGRPDWLVHPVGGWGVVWRGNTRWRPTGFFRAVTAHWIHFGRPILEQCPVLLVSQIRGWQEVANCYPHMAHGILCSQTNCMCWTRP